MSATIIYGGPIEIKVDAPTLAKAFWDLDEDEQAIFFNALGAFKERFPFQMQHVAYSVYLQDDGRAVMQTIGDYALRGIT